jgi:hypothetical protein
MPLSAITILIPCTLRYVSKIVKDNPGLELIHKVSPSIYPSTVKKMRPQRTILKILNYFHFF